MLKKKFFLPCEQHKQNPKNVCVSCGLVLGLELSTAPPSRGHGSQAERDRRMTNELAPTTTPHRYIDGGLGGTLPNFRVRSEAGLTLRRAKNWGERGRERGLRRVLRELDKTAERLSLPRHVQGEVAHQFRTVQRKGGTRGHDNELTMRALIYIVCRQRGIARTLKEIGGDRFRLNREVKRLLEKLGLRLPIKSPAELAKEILPRFASRLGLDNEAVMRGLAVLDNNGGHQGKTPAVLAGAVLYKVGGLPLAVINERLGVGSSNMSITAKALFSPL